MRGRQPVETVISELKFTSRPLPFPQAQELLPEVAHIVALAFEKLGAAVAGGVKGEDDVLALLPALVPIVEHFGQGKLTKLSSKLFLCTSVVMADHRGESTNFELGNEKHRTEVFDDYPEAYLPALFFAGRVTYERFFPAAALRKLREKLAAARSAKSNSSPSTPSTPTPTE